MNAARYLLAHPESDCVWEVFSEEERLRDLNADPLVEDVTGVAEWEFAFSQSKTQKK